MESLESLVKKLKDKGLKSTPQRLAILEALFLNTRGKCKKGIYRKGEKKHPCATGIYNIIRKQHPTISLKTVYKTLKDLEVLLLNFPC